MTDYINYMGISIEYTLEKKPVRRINLRIRSDGQICVSAPHSASIEYIRSFVEKKAEWIVFNSAKLEKIKESQPGSSVFTGKAAFILGKSHTIAVHMADKNSVSIEGGNIHIHSRFGEGSGELLALYLDWLQAYAMPVYSDILNRMYPLVAPFGVALPSLSIRRMRTRWGSATATRGSIRLSLSLIKTPEEFIEGVTLHELVHFIHPNHSKSFYNLLEELMPDYKLRSKALSQGFDDGLN